MKKIVLLLLAAFLSAPSYAGIVTINAAADQTISDNNQDGVPDGFLSIGDGFLRTGFYPSHWRSAIEFDLAALGTSPSITSADLLLRDGGSSLDGILNIWGYIGDGTIGLGDGAETGLLVGAVNIVAAAGIQDFSIDVTTFLQGAVDGGASYAGFLIGAATPTGLGGAASDMCASADGSYLNCEGVGPRLNVAFDASPAPAPGPILLMGLGLLLMTAKRRLLD